MILGIFCRNQQINTVMRTRSDFNVREIKGTLRVLQQINDKHLCTNYGIRYSCSTLIRPLVFYCY